MYKYLLNIDKSINLNSILKLENEKQLVIPFDPANTDYQEYLSWLDEGNTPEPAEE